MKQKLRGVLSGFFILIFALGIAGFARGIPVVEDSSWVDKTETSLHFAVTSVHENPGTFKSHTPRIYSEIGRYEHVASSASLLPRINFRPIPFSPFVLVGKSLLAGITRLQAHAQRDYVSLFNRIKGLKPLPVCNYYIFALRHILI